MAFISRGSEIPFVAYFICKDTSKVVVEQKDFFPMDGFFRNIKLRKKGTVLGLDCKQMFARK